MKEMGGDYDKEHIIYWDFYHFDRVKEFNTYKPEYNLSNIVRIL